MVKKDKLFIILVVGVIIVLFSCACYKNYKNHIDKMYLVVNNRIEEAALKCYLKKDCSDKITLQDLYDKEYLYKQIDPVTKEDMNVGMCINYIDGKIEYC